MRKLIKSIPIIISLLSLRIDLELKVTGTVKPHGVLSASHHGFGFFDRMIKAPDRSRDILSGAKWAHFELFSHDKTSRWRLEGW
jgi:hypothetical protein